MDEMRQSIKENKKKIDRAKTMADPTPKAKKEPSTPKLITDIKKEPETPKLLQNTEKEPESLKLLQNIEKEPESLKLLQNTEKEPESLKLIQIIEKEPETPKLLQIIEKEPETPKLLQIIEKEPETPKLLQNIEKEPIEKPPIKLEKTNLPSIKEILPSENNNKSQYFINEDFISFKSESTINNTGIKKAENLLKNDEKESVPLPKEKKSEAPIKEKRSVTPTFTDKKLEDFEEIE